MAFMHWCCWKHQEILSAEEKENKGDLKRFSLKELQAATNYFSEKNLVGGGGFGKVYKGYLQDGSSIAVKRLDREFTSRVELMFKAELKMISMPVHQNLLRLLGYCVTPTERLLVYPYMVNGSVESWLRGDVQSHNKPLSWSLRKRIALGSAKGLAYLHQCNPRIIHRDVKAANILLDECFEAVVSDFGLVKLMDWQVTHETTAVCGTIGYIAPEYFHTGKSSEKSDVYGYGIMLLELITGLNTFNLCQMVNEEDATLFDWVKRHLVDGNFWRLVDPNLQGKYESNDIMHMLQVALLCTRGSPQYRPSMSEVVIMLETESLVENWTEWWKKFDAKWLPLRAPLLDDSTANLKAEELSGPR